jgi:hypothetical protein
MGRKKRSNGNGAAGNSSGEATTLSGYWEPLLRAHPEWWKGKKKRSNTKAVEQWQADHPGEKFSPQWRQALQNVKSRLRHEKGSRKKAAAEGAAAPAAARPAPRHPRSLVALEEQIDDCLMSAKALGRDAVGQVIDLLREARNKIIVAGSTK